MGRLSVRAIVLGGLFDVVTAALGSLVISLAIRALLGEMEIPAPVADSLMVSPAMKSIELIIDAICTIAGGFIAAEIAARRALVHGALSAWLMVLSLAYYLYFDPWNFTEMGFCVVSPAFGLLGGYLKRG